MRLRIQIRKFIFFLNVLAIIGLVLAHIAYWVDPKSAIWPSFFGLLFPLFLLINVACVFFWLALKKRLFLYSLIVVIASADHIGHNFQLPFFKSKLSDSKAQLNLMSFNVRVFDLYNWGSNEVSLKKILDFVNDQNPDVVCFQEYYYQENSAFATRDSLIKMGYIHYAEGFSKITTNGQSFGIATFSKFPVIDNSVIRFDNDNLNNALFTDILFDNDTLRIYNAHVGSIRFSRADYNFVGIDEKTAPKHTDEPMLFTRIYEGYERRASQIEQITEHMQDSPYPVVFCGDVNDTPVSATYRKLSRKLTDAFIASGSGTGSSYALFWLPVLRIDYIMYEPEVIKTSSFTTHQVYLSDHKPISCKLSWGKKR
jgi:endonuclease/exonuclease/phosphatase family metal-dependent hydrolase